MRRPLVGRRGGEGEERGSRFRSNLHTRAPSKPKASTEKKKEGGGKGDSQEGVSRCTYVLPCINFHVGGKKKGKIQTVVSLSPLWGGCVEIGERRQGHNSSRQYEGKKDGERLATSDGEYKTLFEMSNYRGGKRGTLILIRRTGKGKKGKRGDLLMIDAKGNGKRRGRRGGRNEVWFHEGGSSIVTKKRGG